jgi:hypothetical protein
MSQRQVNTSSNTASSQTQGHYQWLWHKLWGSNAWAR